LKLSLEKLAQALKADFGNATPFGEAEIGRALALGADELEEGCIAVALNGRAPAHRSPKGALLFFGAKQLGMEGPCIFIEGAQGASAAQDALRALNSLFWSYAEWQSELLEGVVAGDLGRLLSASAKILSSGVAAIRSDGIVLSSPPNIGNGLFAALDRSADGARQLSKENAYSARVEGKDALFYNVFVEGALACRIAAAREGNAPFLADDMRAMNLLGRSAASVLQSTERSKSWSRVDSPVSQLAKKLMDGEHADERDVKKALEESGWIEGESCYVGLIHRVWEGMSMAPGNEFYAHYLANAVPGAHPVLRKGRLYVILQDRLFFDKEGSLARLTLFVRDNNLRIGVSNAAASFSEIPPFVRQAEFALEEGLKEEGNSWIFHFRKYAVHYLASVSQSEMPAHSLASEELLALWRYDQANKSEYCDTLYIYLSCKMNSAQAAKELSVHIATMAYRLKRVSEIGRVDFSDFHQLAYIYFSYFLLGIAPSKRMPR
jgi:hypothetical protein